MRKPAETGCAYTDQFIEDEPSRNGRRVPIAVLRAYWENEARMVKLDRSVDYRYAPKGSETRRMRKY